MTNFPQNLKTARKRAGYTQEWMAEQLHVHRTTYTKYENGVVQPDLEKFYQIIKILQVDPMDLLE